jgi:uncharacterized protein YegJ (DUF2314 family)
MAKPIMFAAMLFVAFAVATPSLPVSAQTSSTADEKKAAKAEKKAKAKEARKVARERQKKCGAEWKEVRAAGKAGQHMTWPKYYSECTKRLKEKAA